MKQFIVEASSQIDFELSIQDFETFIGILMLTSYYVGSDQQEYWSTNPILACDAVRAAMCRNKFLAIKSKIKYCKEEDKDQLDKAWRVRKIIDMFRKCIQLFGNFSTAVSVDKMMVRAYNTETVHTNKT